MTADGGHQRADIIAGLLGAEEQDARRRCCHGMRLHDDERPEEIDQPTTMEKVAKAIARLARH